MGANTLEEKAKEYIAAEVRLFSGCKDEQTSADVSNVKKYGLPKTVGKAGGACTSAMLRILYDDDKDKRVDLTYAQILLKLRKELSSDFSQIPQLSSSRPMDMDKIFRVIPENFTGTRRAVMIGINYKGLSCELSGCQNDCYNMINYIKDVHGFKDNEITILMDDGKHTKPTKKNILAAYKKLADETMPGDAVFIHYAGHGGKMKDVSGDEDDGYDETMIPVDFAQSGQILDDELFKVLVCPMPQDVTMTCVVDCCHSGTILDLPFVFQGKDSDHITKVDDVRFPHMNIVKAYKATAPVKTRPPSSSSSSMSSSSNKDDDDGKKVDSDNNDEKSFFSKIHDFLGVDEDDPLMKVVWGLSILVVALSIPLIFRKKQEE